MIPGQVQRTDRPSSAASSSQAGGRDDQDEVRGVLIAAIDKAMRVRQLNQVQAARLCGTDQPTLSKVLRGRTASVTLDKLFDWLARLGCSIEIRIADEGALNRGLVTASSGTEAERAHEGKS